MEITNLYLLIVAALGTRERTHLARAEGRDDGSLVPVEDVTALLAPLPEGHDRAPLVHDHTPRHLYRHASVSLANPRRVEDNCTRDPPMPAPLDTDRIDCTVELVVSYLEHGDRWAPQRGVERRVL